MKRQMETPHPLPPLFSVLFILMTDHVQAQPHKFFPSIDLQNSRVDSETPPEPESTKWLMGETLCPEKSLVRKLHFSLRENLKMSGLLFSPLLSDYNFFFLQSEL